MRLPTTRSTIAAVATIVLVAGCSSGDDASSGETETVSGVAAPAGTIAATAVEFQFTPDAWTVPAGDEFTIDFTNDGTTEHEWAVIALGDDLEDESDFEEGKVLLEVEAIDAGTTSSEQFTIEEPGTYQVICGLPGHFNEGMEGTLTVE